MRYVICIIALVLSLAPVSAQTLADRIGALEKSNADTAARLDSVDKRLASIEAKLGLGPSVPPVAHVQAVAAPASVAWSVGYGSDGRAYYVGSDGSCQAVGGSSGFAASAGVGSCANGSCGSSGGAGRVGLFGRLRGR